MRTSVYPGTRAGQMDSRSLQNDAWEWNGWAKESVSQPLLRCASAQQNSRVATALVGARCASTGVKCEIYRSRVAATPIATQSLEPHEVWANFVKSLVHRPHVERSEERRVGKEGRSRWSP